ncbi:phenylalanine--tRNA ligase subunit beta [Candidatus Endoriftia persephonae]|jgi:phenylalanyl-tRNA synthetase beta chain|uniref:Phenylalanine--tRNA ligase beta subunit n=2 Tax=Gammaproteobacteria TaxID=1236 RepID=G2FCP9_9GAMM|nr:phenylalanine--tRNA ligase subunit beta [Candidatus Endoriftia persephone]EGW55279.1 phenylalanine--tRNA ligase beta chain [endosymbiont of Tevnia jerichonana (vent Tica)]USF88800.1 phenylalanine--tRNA ligase subunit beta [Candidatus Endoriftia persephone]
MKFSEAWLREWANPAVATEELAEQFSMAGLEVDSVEPVAPAFSGVVVGEVLAIEPHPDANKLRICSVNVNAEEPLQIICGAANVAEGMRVPVAVVGARLPGDFKIKKAKLRGVQSLGMICSASELGLADSSDGIMPLPADAPVGDDFRDWLQLDDQTIDIDLTPDRGDCLGIAGIAREVGVINRCPVTSPQIDEVPAVIDDRFEVQLEATEACPRYLCRVIKGINPTAETPIWMQERLRRSGIRSLSPVVDVTNYVLLELGQPMHGFDLGQLSAPVRVRMAKVGEKLTLLGGQEIELKPDTLLIADANRPLALAGIMGGEGSGVSAETSDILLESAFFSPTAIIGKARAYGLHTDSSHRFERGVDPQLQAQAMQRATALLLDIVGGEAGPVVEVSDEEKIEARPQILLRHQRIQRLLGIEISTDEVEDILSRLEMQFSVEEGGWLVTAPSCRFDISIEADLIEEVGRIYGYARIPTRRGAFGMELRGRAEADFDLLRAKELLVSRDYQEVITYSFISPELHKQLDPGRDGVRLANPISADMSVMRTSLWPGLLQTARYNLSRQQERVRIFESGLRFLKSASEIDQRQMLAGLITGPQLSEQWGGAARAVDFFDLKADLEALFTLTGAGAGFAFSAAEHPALHPGQSAAIEFAGRQIGWIGMLHPALEQQLDLDGSTYLFEVELEALNAGRLPAFAPLSKFPSIRRDIALLMDAEIPFDRVKRCVQTAAPEIVKDIRLFDVYTGEKVDSGRKSLALGLILQESSHTLTDEEVDAVVDAVLKRLADELGAKLRE